MCTETIGHSRLHDAYVHDLLVTFVRWHFTCRASVLRVTSLFASIANDAWGKRTRGSCDEFFCASVHYSLVKSRSLMRSGFVFLKINDEETDSCDEKRDLLDRGN